MKEYSHELTKKYFEIVAPSEKVGFEDYIKSAVAPANTSHIYLYFRHERAHGERGGRPSPIHLKGGRSEPHVRKKCSLLGQSVYVSAQPTEDTGVSLIHLEPRVCMCDASNKSRAVVSLFLPVTCNLI